MAGVKLATPSAGGGFLERVSGRAVQSQSIMIAAWQALKDVNNDAQPTRVVVRIDGDIVDPKATADTYGFPCAVARVDYTIGGLKRSVLLDAVNQSALVVWAQSVDVVPVWDERRIARLASFGVEPCRKQYIAAAISVCCNDTGAADARYLDVIKNDHDAAAMGQVYSVHPIPPGARAVRLLGGYDTTSEDTASPFMINAYVMAFVNNVDSFFAGGPANVQGIQPWSAVIQDYGVWITVPAGATDFLVAFASNDEVKWTKPAMVEWLVSPSHTPGGR